MHIIRTDMPEGNAYNIMGVVVDMLRQIHGWRDAQAYIEEYRAKATSGDYENLKEVSKKCVPELIDFAHSSEVRMTIVSEGD